MHPYRQEFRTFRTISGEQTTPGRITSAYSNERLDSTSRSSESVGKPCPVGSLRRVPKTEPNRQVTRAASTRLDTDVFQISTPLSPQQAYEEGTVFTDEETHSYQVSNFPKVTQLEKIWDRGSISTNLVLKRGSP